jgi:uncharacterized protein (TIGR02301 family)
MTRVPDQIALRRHCGRKTSVRYLLAMMVGATVFFGASDVRSLTQVSPAAAKSRSSAPRNREQAPEQPAPTEQSAPYDHDLQRLSEILGALHFLRGICNSNEGQKWRNEALALIDAEAPSGKRHDKLVASFNRGYSGFQQSYRTCTSAADVVVRRYLEEGARIARDMTARYSNY